MAWKRHCWSSVSWRGVCDRCRHTAAVQPAVRFGGSSLYTTLQSATATRHRPHTYTSSGDCRAWLLCVTCRMSCTAKSMYAFQDWTQLGYSCSHQSQMTPSVHVIRQCHHCHAARASSTIQYHSYPHTHVSTDLPENVDLGISYVTSVATNSLSQTAAEV